jgi:hypothetical protein
VRCNLGLPIPPLPPRMPLFYTTSRTSIAPSESSLTVKDGPVVTIGVDRGSVGGDDGARLVKGGYGRPCELRLLRPLSSSGERAGPRM